MEKKKISSRKMGEQSIMLRIGKDGKLEYVRVNPKTGFWKGLTSVITEGPKGKIRRMKKMTHTGLVRGVEGQLKWQKVRRRVRPEIIDTLRRRAHTYMSLPSAVYVRKAAKSRKPKIKPRRPMPK